MTPLYDFYLAALDADLQCAPRNEFSARMQSFYCRTLLALETLALADAARQRAPLAPVQADPGTPQ